jgi:hypothetical protein
MTEFAANDLWKGIVLFGKNQASYKMALGKVLLNFGSQNRNVIQWEDLSAAFLDQYISRLEENSSPQQNAPGRQTKLERVVAELRLGTTDYGCAVQTVSSEGLVDVVPRFQTIGNNKDLVGKSFFEFEFGKRIFLKDSLLEMATYDSDTLQQELDSRWALLEGAFEIRHSDLDLKIGNNIRDTYLVAAHQRGSVKRRNLTKNVDFLKGYQGNICFFCQEPLVYKIHVDHVLPRDPVLHDQIWNLVLACETCNEHKSDRMIGPHFIEKLVFRNENIMGGKTHPKKKEISGNLGATRKQRSVATYREYEKVKAVKGSLFWGDDEKYDPSKDEFYKKLITIINNGQKISFL